MENLIVENPLMAVISILSILLAIVMFVSLVKNINTPMLTSDEKLSDEEIKRRANWDKLAKGTYIFKELEEKKVSKLKEENIETFKKTTGTKLRLAKSEEEKKEIQAEIDFLKNLGN